MGETDLLLYDYMGSNVRFADLFNVGFFSGRQVIQAAELSDASEKYVCFPLKPGDLNTAKPFARIRDIKKYHKSGTAFRILAVENQTQVDYTMPLRNMEYDAYEYRRQLDAIRTRRVSGNMQTDSESSMNPSSESSSKSSLESSVKLSAKSSAEFLSGFLKNDRLIPCFTAILYIGDEKWDGARSMKDMMNFGDNEEFIEYFHDYPLHLICVNEMDNYKLFKSDLKLFFEVLGCRKDKEKMIKLIKDNPDYESVPYDTARVISRFSGVKDVRAENDDEKGGTVNMCDAIREMLEDSKKEGYDEGHSLGINQGISEGFSRGISQEFVNNVASLMKNMNLSLKDACKALGSSVEEYQLANTMLEQTK